MDEPAAYLVPAAGADVAHEIEVRRSRFLCLLRRTPNEAAARAFVTEQRRAHPTARHHCSAFVVGSRRDLQRSSDDGEPAGTAGMPMLQVLLGADGGRGAGAAGRQGAGREPGVGEAPGAGSAGPPGPLSDVTAVVVRWFGGTLLGAGGLVRAYSEAVAGVLAVAPLVVRERRALLRIAVRHDVAGRIEHDLRAAGVLVADLGYGADGVEITVAVADAPGSRGRFSAWCAEHRVVPEAAGHEWVDVAAG
ncbi:YigZ family protein [Patulibacter sp. NPDC049589]|uniref:IMPACT family protein n=1 Tax=Patulibacter sp. NPDC049589 TaxID=3154731 RepID=UPI003447AE20